MLPLRPRTKILLFGVVPVLIVGFLLRHQVMEVVRSWRYETNVEKAQSAFADDNLIQASQFLGAAWRLKRGDLAVLRELLPLAEKFRSPDLGSLAAVLFSHPEATLEDQAGVLEVILRQNDLFLANNLYESLPEDRRQAPRMRFTYANYLERSGETLEAVELAGELVNSEWGAEAKFQLTRLLPMLKNNPLASARCCTYVADLMNAGDRNALAAFRNLRLLPPDQRALPGSPNLAEWLTGHPEAQFSDRLLAAEITMITSDDAGRSALIDGIVERYRDEQPKELAAWLLQIGERDRILELPEEVLRSDPSFYAACLQVLIDQDRFEETRQWIADPHPKLSKVLVEAVRAGLAWRERDDVQRVLHLRRAFEKADFDKRYGSYLVILRIAAKFEDGDTVRRASRAIALLPPRSLPPIRELHYIDIEFGDDPDFLEEYYVRMEGSRPNDPVVRHHLALLRLLCGRELDKSTTTLAELGAAYPKILGFQCSRALAQHLDGQGESALAHLKRQAVDWNTEASDYEKAAYALLQRLHGDERIALALEEGLDAAKLPGYQRTFFLEQGLGGKR